jgi:hypothetical protein
MKPFSLEVRGERGVTPRIRCAFLLVALSLAGAVAQAAPGETSAGREPALVIEQGGVARRQVVALGRDVVVSGRALADVAAMNGEVRVSGEVAGDVIVLGGGAHLAATAAIGGDVFVLGGTIDAAPGATISGRSVAYPDASAAWLALLEAPTLGLSAASTLVVGAKLALLTAWLVLVLVFFAASGRQVLATSESVAREPFRCFSVGLTGVLALTLTALLMSLFAAALVGVPLLVLVVLLALVLKLWGMVAVFHALGAWLAQCLFRRRLSPLNAATLGLVVLGAVKLVPWVGLLAWQVATFIGVGAALVTKLGRREPWFDLSPQPSV